MYIAAGMGYNPMDPALKDFLDRKFKEPPGYETAVYQKWQEHQQQIQKIVAALPTHKEFLEKTIYNTNIKDL
jgi:uncharacterized protein YaaN involved in tellurite resistance